MSSMDDAAIQQVSYSFPRRNGDGFLSSSSFFEDFVDLQIMEKQILTVAKAVEDKLDDEITALDRLDLDDLEALRERRMQQLKKMAEKRSRWLSLGHGEYQELHSEKDFFAAVKASDRVVCHFYRENWPCKVPYRLLLHTFFIWPGLCFIYVFRNPS